MSAVDAGLDDAAGQPAVPGRAGGPRGRPRRRRAMAAAVLVAVLAAVALAATWRSWDTARQPITWGCCEESPVGSGIRGVNIFAHYREDLYVPPQRGRFVLFATIQNEGSRPVRIEKVTIGETDGMLRLAGPVRYSRGFVARRLAAVGKLPVLRDVVLAAGGGLSLAIALRTWPCASRSGWVIDPSFYLTVRSVLFSRTIALPWTRDGGAVIMRPSAGRRPGLAGSFCVAR